MVMLLTCTCTAHPADALNILKTFFNTQILDGAISLLNLSFPATLVPLLLLRCGTRGGIGGRLKREDPHQDPTVDPKKADRVLNNRLAAARSKLKQKMAKRVSGKPAAKSKDACQRSCQSGEASARC